MGTPYTEKQVSKRMKETPHEVTFMKGFWILETEVSQKMWKSIMRNNPSHFKGDTLPVESVSWSDVTNFCKRFSSTANVKAALPTEAQWEYACRAGTTGLLSGNLASMSWCGEAMAGRTHPVKSKTANPWGIYDIYGNVSEWCYDWYDDYPGKPLWDPSGPDKGNHSLRVIRGGSWGDMAGLCRSAYRMFENPSQKISRIGFRFVVDADENGF